MSLPRSSGPKYSISLSSTFKTLTRVLPVFALAAIACCLFAPPAHATATCGGSLSCGTFSPYGVVRLCGSGWYYYTNGSTNTYMNCQKATATCSAEGIAPWTATFGYLDPPQVSGTGVTTTLGNIVLLGGGGGTSPESVQLADAYFKAGYEVVQLTWDDDWEMTYDPFGTHVANVQNAACRPATFLYYVYTTLFANLNNQHPAMCALGTSAGSAAIAYSLAYYGASGWLDNVELLSGPVLSDIEQGCGVGSGLGANVTVCDPNSKNGGWGCQLGTGGSTWTLSPSYVGGAQGGVRNWTNDQTCRAGQNTSNGSNTAWLNQSLVDQSTGQQGQGAIPTFSYSPTSMSAWLCRSVQNPNNWDCLANGNSNSNYCPNNSSPEGQIFYSQIPTNTTNYAVYAVDSCADAEGVAGGNVPGYQPLVFSGTVQGVTAITYDMVGYTPKSISPQCVPRH
jgi:hypothetical protein